MSTLRILTAVSLSAAFIFTAACEPRDARFRDTAEGVLDLRDENIRVADVELGRAIAADKRVIDDIDTFSPGDTIYASVRVNKSGALATSPVLTARWIFEDSVTVQEQNQTISPVADEWYTEFHVIKPSPWPKGKYTVVLLLNGREVESESFTVR